MRVQGFILIELLIALSICAVCMALFVNSSNNRMQMLINLEEKYSIKRLKNDISILTAINELDSIDTNAYLPLLVRISPQGLEVEGKYFEQKAGQK